MIAKPNVPEALPWVRSLYRRDVVGCCWGVQNAIAPAVIALIDEIVPGASVAFDSNLIRANVGRGRAPRKLTRARDEASRLIAAGAPFGSAQELGIVLAFGSELDAARARARCLPRGRQLSIFAAA